MFGGPMDFGGEQPQSNVLPLVMKEELARKRRSSPTALSLGQLISLLGGSPGGGGGGTPTIPPVLNTLFNPPGGNPGRPAGGSGSPFGSV